MMGLSARSKGEGMLNKNKPYGIRTRAPEDLCADLDQVLQAV